MTRQQTHQRNGGWERLPTIETLVSLYKKGGYLELQPPPSDGFDQHADIDKQRRLSSEASASRPVQTKLIFRSNSGRQSSTWTVTILVVPDASLEFSLPSRRSCRTLFLPHSLTEYPSSGSPSTIAGCRVRRSHREQTREVCRFRSGWPAKECLQPSARPDRTHRRLPWLAESRTQPC